MGLEAIRFDTIRPGDPLDCPGVVGGTGIRTLDGVLPVEFLTPGDRVICRSGARRLVAVTISEAQEVDLVRIRASTLGHDRPDQDLLVSPAQPVLIRDWRAMALYGQKIAAIPARRLVDGEFILAEAQGKTCLFTLHFAEDEVVYAEGLELACPAPATASLTAVSA